MYEDTLISLVVRRRTHNIILTHRKCLKNGVYKMSIEFDVRFNVLAQRHALTVFSAIRNETVDLPLITI